MITSSSNAQLKQIIQYNKKAKARRQDGVFVAEGIKMFEEAPADQIRRIFVSQSFEEKHGDMLGGRDYEVVEDRLFCSISDTQTPQGVLCILEQRQADIQKILGQEKPFLVLLEDLQDPGNVGTILRTAEGAGVDGVILSANCVDMYNPKTIRSTMGSIYRVPFCYVEDMTDFAGELRGAGIHTYAAHLAGEHTYDQEDYRQGTALMIGNEGNGLSDALTGQAQHLIRIPMRGKVESLNAAMAAGILMYEVARQRR
ncbi:MAG: RNA methyltransferase [Lachnospiraceae bacterium]|nr:RNA methyltransferase [Lachnospiraceae bacterium]